MRIGFICHHRNSQDKSYTGVWGDELVSQFYCNAMNKLGIDAEVYTVDMLDKDNPLDVAIYTTTLIPRDIQTKFAKKSVLWIQGFTSDGGTGVFPIDTLYESNKSYYDRIITASKVLADKCNIPFIIPPVDMDVYKLVGYKTEYAHEISFIGNNIKSFEHTKKFLEPMSQFDYGLYGGDWGKITHEQALEVMCSSTINLHFGFKESIDWDMVTATVFFQSACYGFTMCDKIPFFMEHFKDCFAFTDGGDDEVEKIKFHLDNLSDTKKMSYKAHDIVKEKFSSDILVHKLLETLREVVR
jgi:hypothetical protein